MWELRGDKQKGGFQVSGEKGLKFYVGWSEKRKDWRDFLRWEMRGTFLLGHFVVDSPGHLYIQGGGCLCLVFVKQLRHLSEESVLLSQLASAPMPHISHLLKVLLLISMELLPFCGLGLYLASGSSFLTTKQLNALPEHCSYLFLPLFSVLPFSANFLKKWSWFIVFTSASQSIAIWLPSRPKH